MRRSDFTRRVVTSWCKLPREVVLKLEVGVEDLLLSSDLNYHLILGFRRAEHKDGTQNHLPWAMVSACLQHMSLLVLGGPVEIHLGGA